METLELLRVEVRQPRVDHAEHADRLVVPAHRDGDARQELVGILRRLDGLGRVKGLVGQCRAGCSRHARARAPVRCARSASLMALDRLRRMSPRGGHVKRGNPTAEVAGKPEGAPQPGVLVHPVRASGGHDRGRYGAPVPPASADCPVRSARWGIRRRPRRRQGSCRTAVSAGRPRDARRTAPS